jgi:hypothetical protein
MVFGLTDILTLPAAMDTGVPLRALELKAAVMRIDAAAPDLG